VSDPVHTVEALGIGRHAIEIENQGGHHTTPALPRLVAPSAYRVGDQHLACFFG
jgi:hypothetical protein